MSRTYTKGRYSKNLWKVRKGYARRGCPHGHCWICGYEPRSKGYKKTQHNNFMKFHVLPFVKENLI